MKKTNATKKVGAKKKSAVTRIKPVNMKSEEKKLDSNDVEGQILTETPKDIDYVGWACAAVRG